MMIAVISTNPNVYSWVKNSVENKGCVVVYATTLTELLHILNTGMSVQAVIWQIADRMQESLLMGEQIARQYPKVRFMVIVEGQECSELMLERLKRKAEVLCTRDHAEQVQASIGSFIDKLDVPAKFTEELIAADIEICSGIIFKPHLHCLLKNGKLYPLPEREFQLLMFLIKNRGRFVTTEQILHTIWDEYTGPETARQYIYKLRRKLKTDKLPYPVIFYLKGVGYTLIREENHYLTELASDYALGSKARKAKRLAGLPSAKEASAL